MTFRIPDVIAKSQPGAYIQLSMKWLFLLIIIIVSCLLQACRVLCRGRWIAAIIPSFSSRSRIVPQTYSCASVASPRPAHSSPLRTPNTLSSHLPLPRHPTYYGALWRRRRRIAAMPSASSSESSSLACLALFFGARTRCRLAATHKIPSSPGLVGPSNMSLSASLNFA
jgi:hypothetical protein